MKNVGGVTLALIVSLASPCAGEQAPVEAVIGKETVWTDRPKGGRRHRRRQRPHVRWHGLIHFAGRRVHAQKHPDPPTSAPNWSSESRSQLENDEGIFKPGMPADALFN